MTGQPTNANKPDIETVGAGKMAKAVDYCNSGLSVGFSNMLFNRDRDGRTTFEQMKLDKSLVHRRTFEDKKQGRRRQRRRSLEFSPYETLLHRQLYLCAICRKADQTGRALAIDHDHNTNLVRGLLCGKCNRALGMFGDNIETLLAAVKYLQNHVKEQDGQHTVLG